jgi:phosphoribosylanthranilate isomerase
VVKVKICGITNKEDAVAAADAGCDALGFVFYKKSPRYVEPEKVKDIIKGLAPEVIKIGVFVNARERTIRRIAKACSLDMLQFHGNESPEFCGRFKGYKVIKAFRIKDHLDENRVRSYKTFAYLFDTFAEGKIGGTGKGFNWSLVRHFCGMKPPVFLSGGLSKENVRKAICEVRPSWVDASTSLETSPGKKDHQKVKAFIKAAKQCSQGG